MRWFLIINDAKCRKEFQQFLKKNHVSVLYKGRTNESLQNLEVALKGASLRGQHSLIAINSTNNLQLVKVQEIMHCQSNHSYTQIFLANGTKITASKNLKQVEQLLATPQFVRVHQSHLVNINYIVKYLKGDGGHVVLANGIELPVASRKKENLIKLLSKL